MTRLQDQILKTFSENKYAFVIDNISYETLFKKTYAIYILLDLLELDEDHTVLLSGEVNEHWIAVYYACLLKDVNLFILPNQLEFEHFPFYINRLNVAFAFLSGKKIQKAKEYDSFKKMPFVKGLFDLDKYQSSLARLSVANILYSSAEICNRTDDIDTDLGLDTISNTLYKKQSKWRTKNSSVYTITSGVEENHPKIVEHTHESILRAVTNVSEILDFHPHNYLNILPNTIDKYHVIIVLNSFLSKSKLCTSPYMHVSHNVFDTISFIKWWKSTIESQISSNFWYRLLKQINFSFIQKWMYVRVLNKHGLPKENKIIILNGTIPYRIISYLAKRKNVIITFGDEENNHAIAYNDLSNRQLQKSNCIGYAFPSVSIHSNSDETKIISDHLFERYMLQDIEFSNKLREDMFITNDNIRIISTSTSNPVLFFDGRRSHCVDNVAYDLFERELKGSRFIKNAIFARHPENESIILIVDPDIEEVEQYNLGYMGLEKRFDDMLAIFNTENIRLASDSILLTDKGIDLITFDGKNKNLLNSK